MTVSLSIMGLLHLIVSVTFVALATWFTKSSHVVEALLPNGQINCSARKNDDTRYVLHGNPKSKMRKNGNRLNVFKSFEIIIPSISCNSSQACSIIYHVHGKRTVLDLHQQQTRLSTQDMSINVGLKRLTNTESLKMDKVLVGKMRGITDSFAYVHIIDLENNEKTINAYITIGNEFYFIEPYSKYLKGRESYKHNIECIIYKNTDVEQWNVSTVGIINGMKNAQTAFKSKKQFSGKKNAHSRFRRSPSTLSHTCPLHVVADHTFHINIGDRSISRTFNEVMYLIGIADVIFRSTDFDGDGQGDNIGFTINAFTVFPSTTTPGYTMSDTTSDSFTFLDQLILNDFSDSCLGYAFTYRDFNEGIVGVAYIGNSNEYGSVGGLCQPPVRISDDIYYSYNTGVVSMLNYDKRIPAYRAALTLAHELGHSFGSTHDESSSPHCVPDDEYGNYIMFPFSLDGSLANHNRFSNCSINLIYPVIVNKGFCLITTIGPICGNRMVEAGEECDCGSAETCQMLGDECCVASDSISGLDLPCTYRRSIGKMCSPNYSQCCKTDCSIRAASENYKCQEESACRNSAFCNGTDQHCTPGTFKSDGILCDDHRRTCLNGTCLTPICDANNLVSCDCIEPNLCKLCCRFPNTTTCLPIETFDLGYTEPIGALYTSGEPCKQNSGICDASGHCVLNDYSSAMNRLMSVFDKDNMNSVKTWFKNYWYYVVVAIAGFIFLLCIFFVTKRKTDTTHFDALRVGKLNKVREQSEQELLRQNELLQAVEDRFDKKIKEIKRGQEKREYTEALARIGTFFPTVPITVISQTISTASNEELAIYVLVLKGYPMRKLVLNSDNLGQPIEET